MKNIYVGLTVLCLCVVFSCKNTSFQLPSKNATLEIKKTNDSINILAVKKTYCYEIIENPLDSLLLPKEYLAKIHKLFNDNELSFDDLQFYDYSLNSNYGNINIRANKYVNGLKLFLDEAIFNFKKDGTYKKFLDNSIPDINLDVEPKSSPDLIIAKFISELSKDRKVVGRIELPDTRCFELEFGYYNQNFGTDDTTKIYKKLWLITLKDEKYPFMYVDDASADSIYYDNGIRS